MAAAGASMKFAAVERDYKRLHLASQTSSPPHFAHKERLAPGEDRSAPSGRAARCAPAFRIHGLPSATLFYRRGRDSGRCGLFF